MLSRPTFLTFLKFHIPKVPEKYYNYLKKIIISSVLNEFVSSSFHLLKTPPPGGVTEPCDEDYIQQSVSSRKKSLKMNKWMNISAWLLVNRLGMIASCHFAFCSNKPMWNSQKGTYLEQRHFKANWAQVPIINSPSDSAWEQIPSCAPTLQHIIK